MEYKNPYESNISEILNQKISNIQDSAIKLRDLQNNALKYDICTMVQLFSTNTKIKTKYMHKFIEQSPLLLEWSPSKNKSQSKKILKLYQPKIQDLKQNNIDNLHFLFMQKLAMGILDLKDKNEEINQIIDNLDIDINNRYNEYISCSNDLLSANEKRMDLLMDKERSIVLEEQPNENIDKEIETISQTELILKEKLDKIRIDIQELCEAQVSKKSSRYMVFLNNIDSPDKIELLEYVKTNFPEDYDKIQTVNLNPKDIILIIQDYVVNYSNIYTFIFLKDFIELFLLLAQKDFITRKSLSIISSWIQTAKDLNPSFIEEINILEQKFITFICKIMRDEKICVLLSEKSTTIEQPTSNIKNEITSQIINTSDEGADSINIEEQIEIYPHIIILPSFIPKNSIEFHMEPNYENGILSLAPPQYNYNFSNKTKTIYFKKLKKIFQLLHGKEENTIEEDISEFWKKNNQSYGDFTLVIVNYITKIKKIRIQTEEFCNRIIDLFDNIITKYENGNQRIFTPVSSHLFPHTSEGDKLYIRLLQIMGYIGSSYIPFEDKIKISNSDYRLQKQKFNSTINSELNSIKMNTENSLKLFRSFLIKNINDLDNPNIQNEMKKELIEAAENSNFIDIIQFTVICFKEKPEDKILEIGPIFNRVKCFHDMIMIMKPIDKINMMDQQQYNSILKNTVMMLVGNGNPEIVGKIPIEYFIVSVEDPEFYEKYEESFELLKKRYDLRIESEKYQNKLSDQVARLAKLLRISNKIK